MRRLYWITVIGIVALGSGIWLERTQLLAWYYVHELSAANPENRDLWMARTLSLEEAVVPSLIACLSRNDEQACDNATLAMRDLVERWGLDDPRAISLSSKVCDGFLALSGAGQEKILRMEQAWFSTRNTHPAGLLIQNACRLLLESAKVPDSEVHQQALCLAAEILGATVADKTTADPILLDACRELARAGLGDRSETNRLLAVRLAQRPEVSLLTEIVPLLRDNSALVRREAILALGPAPEVIGDDHLFYWLNDPDAEVRALCEMALRGRGLQENHIRLAKLMADRRPAVRLQVIESLGSTPDLDPGVWLRRLSHDPTPAIRAAAARAATSQAQIDLSDRIEQMAQNDPSPTVQQVARYYLSCQRLRANSSAP